MKTKYANIRIRGDDSKTPKVAAYNATSTAHILDKSNDWMVSISRFYLTTTRLPVYLVEVPNATQTVYKYSVVLKYQAITVEEGIDAYLLANSTGTISGRPVIYSYDAILTSVNNAYSSAYAALAAHVGVLPNTFPTAPPILNRMEDNRIQFLIPVEYETGAVQVGFNEALMNKLGPVYTEQDGSAFYLNLETYVFNQVTIDSSVYINVIEPGTSLVNWNTIKQVVFKSSMPVDPELRSGQSAVKDQILTDFNITGIIDSTPLSFYPEGPLRQYNLLSADPLYTIDLKVYFRDLEGIDYPWMLHADDLVSCKLRFDSR